MSLSPYFYGLDRPFRLMERQFFRPDFLHPYHLGMHDYFNPRQYYRSWDAVAPWHNEIKPMEQLSSVMSQLALQDTGSKITLDDDKFQVNVDVQHFAPEEVTVKVVDGHVVVEGKHEEKRDHHGYISRRFVRRYTLPQGCLPDTVESKLSSDGVLTVTAPKVLPLPSIGERIVPVTYSGPVQKQLDTPNFESNKEESK